MSQQTHEHPQTRWDEILTIWNTYALEYRILLLVMFLAAGWWVFGDNLLALAENKLGYTTNVFTEALSIIVTIFVLDKLNERRAEKARKEELIALLGSEDNSTALEAARLLRHKGWLQDGSLDYLSLVNANLQDANMEQLKASRAFITESNLSGINFRASSLKGAHISSTNLADANLENADFSNARFFEVDISNTFLASAYFVQVSLKNSEAHRTNWTRSNLEKGYFAETNMEFASLEGVKAHAAHFWKLNLFGSSFNKADLSHTQLFQLQLQGADLSEADLTGAYILRSYLDGANLRGVNLDNVVWHNENMLRGEHTTSLPDGTTWSEGTDMDRFTNENHPKYEETLAQINAIRLTQGQYLIRSSRNDLYPLLRDGEKLLLSEDSLEYETIIAEINTKRMKQERFLWWIGSFQNAGTPVLKNGHILRLTLENDKTNKRYLYKDEDGNVVYEWK